MPVGPQDHRRYSDRTRLPVMVLILAAMIDAFTASGVVQIKIDEDRPFTGFQ